MDRINNNTYQQGYMDSTDALNTVGGRETPDVTTPLLSGHRKSSCAISCYSKAEAPMSYERKKRQQTRRIWRNVVALVAGIGVYTMGLNPIDDLQSSLNASQGLGVTSLSVKYAMMIFGNLLTNTFLIRRLGAKWALVTGALLYSTYIAANFYPTWITLIPVTVVAGLGGALMWTTLGNYLARLASHYALTTGGEPDGVKALFFGIKGVIGYASAAIGGVASSLLLKSFREPGNASLLTSSLGATVASEYAMCGADYCNEMIGIFDSLEDGNVTSGFYRNSSSGTIAGGTSGTLQNMTMGVYVLVGFCMAAALLGTLVIVFLVDGLPRLGIVECKVVSGEPQFSVLLDTVRMWRNPLQLMLVPISFVYGFQEAFWRVEFSKAYITCALGIEYIGFLMVCYNLTALLSSLACGWLGTKRRRLVAFSVTAAVDASALAAMLFWKPTPEGVTIAFVITGITGCTYGALSTLLLAFYGVAFPNHVEAAYSNLYFWSFLGSTLMYAWSYQLCLRIKLIVVLIMVVLGIIGYHLAEVRLGRINSKREKEALANGVRRFLVPAGF